MNPNESAALEAEGAAAAAQAVAEAPIESKPSFDVGAVVAPKGTFAWALECMRAGYKVARAGWNGKGMWITVSPGAKQLPADRFWNVHNRAFAESKGGHADVQPYITMKTAQDQIQMGWLASQSDMLAEDWQVVE